MSTNQEYYNDSNLWGEGQNTTLADIVNNFMLMYVGPDKLIDNATRYNVLFHAKRALQELNYDALRNKKVLEMKVKDDLKFILPPDYVDYIRISLEVDGVLFKLTENTTVNYANAYLQDNNDDFIYDQDGNIITGQSELDIARIKGTPMQTYYVDGLYYGRDGWFYDGYWYFSYGLGGRFGLETSEANVNPKFVIDKASGVINFSSNMSGRLIVLEYISDGLESADPSQLKVHKFAEEFVYSYIKWCMLNNRIGVQEYIVRRAREEKSALLRNAKIRLSSLKPGRLLMVLRGRDKWIK
jgi:hypothetical protein